MSGRRLSPILLSLLALGGCGGADKGNDAAPKVESKADFIAAGDKICHDRDARSLKLAKSAGDGGNVAELTGKLADIYTDAIGSQQALDLPPGSARAGAERYVKSVADMRRPVQRMRAAADDLATAKDAASVKKAAAALQLNVNTVQSIGDLADQRARDYGFKTCGQQQTTNPVA